ncbi:MAG: 16S rRNA processing protein RimM [Deltaproteobacteria bacterium]|nr:16S rRNA processing protein RimM [Deltaproteobacteria bacterium]
MTTHGIEGWLKLRLYNPNSIVLSPDKKVYLEKGEVRSQRQLQKTRPHKGCLLIKLPECNRISDAQQWVGCIVSLPEDELEPLDSGEYYYYQTVGLEVFDLQGNFIGKVTRVWFKEGGDLLVVKGPAREHLIPAVREIIEKIDLPEGKIIINPPPGLLDL